MENIEVKQKLADKNKVEEFFIELYKAIYQYEEGAPPAKFKDFIKSEKFMRRYFSLNKTFEVEFRGSGDSGDIDSIPEELDFLGARDLLYRFVDRNVPWDWVNNEGGYVILKINPFRQKVSLSGGYYVITEESCSEQEYDVPSFINFKNLDNDAF
jgi:hypothetical protein